MNARLRNLATVRPMTSADIAIITALDAQCYPFPWTVGNFADSLHAGYHCSIYETTAAIIGYAVLLLAAGEAHLLNITIAPASQGLGYGRALMQKLITRARQDFVGTMWLEVRPSNLIAHDLYISIGFVEVATRKKYYPAEVGREDALIMCLDLTHVP